MNEFTVLNVGLLLSCTPRMDSLSASLRHYLSPAPVVLKITEPKSGTGYMFEWASSALAQASTADKGVRLQVVWNDAVSNGQQRQRLVYERCGAGGDMLRRSYRGLAAAVACRRARSPVRH